MQKLNENWYYCFIGENDIYGPVSPEQIKEIIYESGNEIIVRNEQSSLFIPISKCEEFRDDIATNPKYQFEPKYKIYSYSAMGGLLLMGAAFMLHNALSGVLIDKLGFIFGIMLLLTSLIFFKRT